jgi:hypothetical protein
LVTGTYGKGRVAVFAGTVLGDAAAGQLAFWHWDDWQQVLGATIDWLTVPTRKPDAAAATAWRAAVTRDITAARGKTALERAVLTRYAPLCSERASADLLIRTALQTGADITPDIADLVDMAVRPYIDVKFAPLARALVGSSLANKASLGLRLLGRSGAPGASAILIKALESGDVASADNQDDADEFGGDVEDPLERRYAIRKGAIVGLSCLGDSAAAPALRKVMEEVRAAGTAPLGNQATVAPERELFGEAAVAATRCGDAAAAADAVGAIIYQRYQLYHLIAMAEQPIQAVGSQAAAIALTKRLAEEGISRQIVRERRMLSRLEDPPAATLPAVAKAVAAETRPCVEGFALSAFGGRTLPAAVIATLGKAHSSEVAAMFQSP